MDHLAINSTTALAGEADICQHFIYTINSSFYRGLDLCGRSNSVQLFCTSNTRGQCRRQHDVPIQPQCQKISAYYNQHHLNIKCPKFEVKLLTPLAMLLENLPISLYLRHISADNMARSLLYPILFIANYQVMFQVRVIY